jgi:hypothetical protein
MPSHTICPVPQQSHGKASVNLARKPVLRRICGDFEVNDPSAIEAEGDQGIKGTSNNDDFFVRSIAGAAGR